MDVTSNQLNSIAPEGAELESTNEFGNGGEVNKDIPFGDLNPEFEPLILDSNRRKSWGDCPSQPLLSDFSLNPIISSQNFMDARSWSERESEEETSEKEGSVERGEDWNSSDETYEQMFPEKANKKKPTSNSLVVIQRRSVRIVERRIGGSTIPSIS